MWERLKYLGRPAARYRNSLAVGGILLLLVVL